MHSSLRLKIAHLLWRLIQDQKEYYVNATWATLSGFLLIDSGLSATVNL